MVLLPVENINLIDGREVLWVYSRVKDDIADVDNLVGIWISNASTTSFLLSNFNYFWDCCNAL
jgi:hypothetical protein